MRSAASSGSGGTSSQIVDREIRFAVRLVRGERAAGTGCEDPLGDRLQAGAVARARARRRPGNAGAGLPRRRQK